MVTFFLIEYRVRWHQRAVVFVYISKYSPGIKSSSFHTLHSTCVPAYKYLERVRPRIQFLVWTQVPPALGYRQGDSGENAVTLCNRSSSDF